MAAMNFPPTPTVGEEYVWEDFVYEWDGEKWTTQVTVVADNHVLKTGDTMTGNFKVKANTLSGTQINTSNGVSAIMHMKADGKYTGRYATFDSGIVEFHDYDGNDNLRNKYLNWNPDTPSLAMMHPHSASVQGTAASSLTRKDYVDAATKGFGLGTETPKPQDADLIENICTFFGGGGENGFNYFDNFAPGIQMFRSGGTGGYGFLGQMQLASDGMAWRLRNNNVWSEWGRVYDTLRPPTALEVGAVSREEFDSVVGALMARIESLESRLPPALVM